MKKLVLLSAFLSPYRSGAEAMVEEVTVRLADDFDITIVTGRYSRKLKKHDVLGKKVAVIRVGLGLSIDKWLFPFLAPLTVGSLKPNIIHAVLETFAGLALYFCRSNAKKILTLQTTNRSFLKGHIVRSPDIVTAISRDLVRIAADLGRKDVIVIPNGIDLSGIKEALHFHAKDSKRVLFVGRLEPMKGVDTLLKSFAKAIKGLDPSVHLRIIGDGSLMNDLKKLAVDLEVDHRVTFTGHIPGKALFDEYAKAQIFCGLSRSEALGNVFLEAQAAGCAVLATNVGGIPEIVKDQVTGILVPPDDIDAAAAELRKLLSDPGLRAKLSIAAQKNAEQYGWDGVAKRYKEILD
jgi:glycosyltransferase involved in cell wall biosynthesis